MMAVAYVMKCIIHLSKKAKLSLCKSLISHMHVYSHTLTNITDKSNFKKPGSWHVPVLKTKASNTTGSHGRLAGRPAYKMCSAKFTNFLKSYSYYQIKYSTCLTNIQCYYIHIKPFQLVLQI